MSAEKVKKATKEETKETTFHCNFCDAIKPLSEMTVLTRFFPLVVACADCSKKNEVRESNVEVTESSEASTVCLFMNIVVTGAFTGSS